MTSKDSDPEPQKGDLVVPPDVAGLGHDEGDDAAIGVAARRSLVALIAIGGLIAGGIWLAGRGEEGPPPTEVDVAPPRATSADEALPAFAFRDVAREAGVVFERRNGATGARFLPETMGSGVAFFDYDGDDDADLLLVDSRSWDPPSPGDPPSLALYRNESTPERVRFVDVTNDAGLTASCYGMGAAVGDVDGDGDVDLYVTAVGPNLLFENDGGRFRRVADAGGAAGDADAWGTSAGFFDADGDGDLDLFCCNYVRWSPDIDAELNYSLDGGKTRAYGPPTNYAGVHMSYFENRGGSQAGALGRFVDRSVEAGVQVSNPATGEPVGKGLGLSFADVDADGDLDVFVANDTVQNFLFENRGDGSFSEISKAAGVAFDRDGRATGAMGIDVADYRAEGVWGFAIGNFANEMSSLYALQGSGSAGSLVLADEAIVEGLGAPSRRALSFGMLFADLDLDGRPDLLQTNGHLESEINKFQPSQHYRQAAQLFWNAGPNARSAFREVPTAALGDLGREIVGRGSAVADVDGDGDLDVCMTQAEGPVLLLRNDTDLGHRWLRVVLESAPRTAIGALVELETERGVARQLVSPTRSYLSQSEQTLTFGLGALAPPATLRVTWPDGVRQERVVEAFDQLVRVQRAE